MAKNSRLPLINAIRLFLILFLIAIPVVWVSLAFTNFNGDLTRVGKLAERDFNWTRPQTIISAETMKSSGISEADVLVVGDSFSAGLIWQASLVSGDLKVATISWPDIGYICKDFTEVIRRAGFKGRVVVIESVERGAHERFLHSSTCANSAELIKYTSYQGGEVGGDSMVSYALNLKGKFLVGLNAIVNSALLRTNSEYVNFYNQVEKGAHLYRIKDGCKFFSNFLCELGLFYYEDYERNLLSVETLNAIRSINSRNMGEKLRLIWVVVPNKSSIYHREVDADFWQNLSNEKLGF
jgi:hypothetical protein